jgi:hypothetical protein
MKWKGMKPEARDYLPAGKEKDRGVSNTFHKVYFPAVHSYSPRNIGLLIVYVRNVT